MNLFHNTLIEKGYEYVAPQTIYSKPEYRKGENKVVVCSPCGWVKINGNIKTFMGFGKKTEEAVKEIISKIP